jgi:hypothetical protein
MTSSSSASQQSDHSGESATERKVPSGGSSAAGKKVNLSALERKVLEALIPSGELYLSFATIMNDAELDRRTVRRCCRSLARKGLSEFAKGLWSEDGEPRGSGYRAHRNASAILREVADA